METIHRFFIEEPNFMSLSFCLQINWECDGVRGGEGVGEVGLDLLLGVGSVSLVMSWSACGFGNQKKSWNLFLCINHPTA